jgi:hypothetical protein
MRKWMEEDEWFWRRRRRKAISVHFAISIARGDRARTRGRPSAPDKGISNIRKKNVEKMKNSDSKIIKLNYITLKPLRINHWKETWKNIS